MRPGAEHGWTHVHLTLEHKQLDPSVPALISHSPSEHQSSVGVKIDTAMHVPKTLPPVHLFSGNF